MSSTSSNGTHQNIVQAAFGYIPSKPPAIAVGLVFEALSLALFVRLIRRRDWWGLCLPIGTLIYCIGFFLRIAMANMPDSEGVLILAQLFTVTSPAAFLAFNYIIYGTFIRNRVGDNYSIIRPQRVARFFVISDVVTFMIQGAGGGLESSASSGKLGSRILLIGLIAQTVSYLVFIFLLIDSHRRIRKDLIASRGINYTRVVYLLYFSSIFVMIRGVYRVVEFAQGFKGFLVTHEVYFYVLDALPLFFATVIYAPFWPGQYISPVPREEVLGMQKLSHQDNRAVDIDASQQP